MLADAGGGRTGLERAGLAQRSTRRLSRRSLLRLGAAASPGTLVGFRPWTTASAAAAGGPALHLAGPGPPPHARARISGTRSSSGGGDPVLSRVMSCHGARWTRSSAAISPRVALISSRAHVRPWSCSDWPTVLRAGSTASAL